MIAILLTALAMQAQISRADVPLIMDAVLDSVAPSDRWAAGDRPLFVDVKRSARAFRGELVPELPSTFGRARRRYLAREYSDAIKCTPPGSWSCGVVDNGVYVAVTSARRAGEPGEYLLSVRVQSTGVRPDGEGRLWGYETELIVARLEGRWQVVGRGTTVAF